ncbi:MAG: GH116 family glycosyl-hydrolase [Verrucomicrobiota bacterium]
MNQNQPTSLAPTTEESANRSLSRRHFVRSMGLGGFSLLAARWPAMAGPFTREDFNNLVPADKKLRPEWLKSLFERGTPEILRGEELRFIGMPVGGLCSGQLYLGGDGKLWLWDIFNRKNATGDRNYAHPPVPSSPIEQGFGLTIDGEKRALDRSGFSAITFRGEYPVGKVAYRDPAAAVEVDLEAFSPFVPLNTADSSLPATVLRYTVRNTSPKKLELELSGLLENAVCQGRRDRPGVRHIKRVDGDGFTFLDCTVASDAPAGMEGMPDYGSMGIALLGKPADSCADGLSAPLEAKLTGSIGRKLMLEPGASATVEFVLTWYFPNLRKNGVPDSGRWYGSRFASALEVATYVAKNFQRLSEHTKLWLDTWYDSTLPYWFLDRTQLNTSILATSTCYRFKSGRFWAWEGVGCCHGTCGHVWQYAQAMGRLFPDLERILRERVDFGLALQADGAIFFRGENNNIPAIDAQAGSILRALREHQMSADDVFLKKNWPGIKRATQWLINKDGDGDGLIVSNQHNTLDADWFGAVAWLSGLYQAALLAAAAMADETADAEFATQCRTIAAKGKTSMVGELFDGDYFINKVDPAHANTINSGTGCEIDQVMGQSWAFQVGLPRVFPEKETKTALQSLWKYNFSPDVGPYRERYKAGRWYAMAGEAGLLMCTFPRKDWDFKQAQGGGDNTFAGYFNECMNGFEYQVAGHMVWEGMVQEGLAITRAVHDRYHASRRNPWNEVECGDHYARSMASYGVYLAACGFENHGPNGHIGFAPRLTPNDFRCAFTAPEGWGTFSQHDVAGGRDARINLRWGKLRLNSIAMELADAGKTPALTVEAAGKQLEVKPELSGRRLVIRLQQEVVLNPGEALDVRLR